MDFSNAAKVGLTKKELLILSREKVKLEKTLGGIRNVTKTPSVMWVVDTNKEHLAITEAKKLGIPVIGILDTNCDPDEVTIGIPGNDDAIRSVQLLTRVIADAVAAGLTARHAKPEEIEPLAEWEQELLAAGNAAASAEVAATEVAATEVAETPAATETTETTETAKDAE
jgi:small subunit ribosomal protein S2